ncbi:hypothetical protein GOP47_0024045 [Adiantum capillus-veneris]|uniref:Alpha-tubulin N-acetyltransferase n=1 Tax=Adiantum capillus-veneris TaxID=13818 RepID=A0A9D4Z568_ADICA|nr:hypothetical protein GOP47_0024045 [Adiantum capillus-veneris]
MEVKCPTACSGAGAATKVKGGQLHITMWNAQYLVGRLDVRERGEVKRVIDEMGLLSAQAQQLKCPVTSFDRICTFRSHRLYMLYSMKGDIPDDERSRRAGMGVVVVKGMLKVGAKDLFFRQLDGSVHEMSPLCVLDFYVHHCCQRNGLGQLLFQHMLSEEGLCAHKLGYDRPSTKFLSLLEKYYGLCKFVPQANQFVVFDAYFDNNTSNSNNGSLNRRGRIPIISS